jgi:hypothetical protein
MPEIKLSVVEAVGKFIGPENIRWFRHVKGLKGEVSCVLRLNYKRKHMPGHPIHLREGMQIRNFMRSLPECKGWTQDQLEKGWVEVIEKLIA